MLVSIQKLNIPSHKFVDGGVWGGTQVLADAKPFPHILARTLGQVCEARALEGIPHPAVALQLLSSTELLDVAASKEKLCVWCSTLHTAAQALKPSAPCPGEPKGLPAS